MNIQKLEAEERKVTGRKVKALRREGVVPANIFGKNFKSKAIQIDQKEFSKVFEKAGETGLIDLVMGKTKNTVLVSKVQRDPVTDDLLHVDFRHVNLKEKITAQVPLEVVGQSPAEKQGLGTLVQMINEIEVEALPTDFPEKIEVNVEKLEKVDDAVLVKDLKIDKDKLTIVDDLEGIVAKVEGIQEEKEPEPVETAEGETPEGEEEAKPEGEEKEAEAVEETPKEQG